MEIFLPTFDPESMVKDTVKLGYSFNSQVLTRAFYLELAQEVSGGPFEEFLDVSLGVYQKFVVFSPDYFSPDTRNRFPLLRELGDAIGAIVRSNASQNVPLRTWQPNDVAVQKYSGRYDGIGRHRDFASDIHLVASFTVMGTGEIGIHTKREDPIASKFLQTSPGSLLLLRAPGLVEPDEDLRITHSVRPPYSSPRISVTYRLATLLGLKGA